eukprot:TRINITY_DN0_c1537_g1_i1.p1 TRINITY_DN0_c1537_g1~~TRINITY_DN0_c1537_g1_i1.p1  ORF type:complete len:223 (+),score=60.38 TRINITY_DN0_c1537_g1_i1:46-714(+)
MTQYGRPEYWEKRYTNDPEPFDWYQRYSGVKDIVTQYITAESKILNVGAGNSRMSEEMYDDGYQNIVNIDVSQIVTKAMQEKYKDKGPNFKYLCMDARNMDFGDGSFDCVVDKGTLDAVLCGEMSTTNAHKMLSEVHRILTPKGVYICISYGQPDHRLPYLDKPDFEWKILTNNVFKPTISTSITLNNDDKDNPNVHFVYICQKIGVAASSKAGDRGFDKNE